MKFEEKKIKSCFHLYEANSRQSYLNGTVFRAGREAMSTVREGQMQDLIMMLLQSLNLHTGNAVIQPLELPVPRHSRCTHTGNALLLSKGSGSAATVWHSYMKRVKKWQNLSTVTCLLLLSGLVVKGHMHIFHFVLAK